MYVGFGIESLGVLAFTNSRPHAALSGLSVGVEFLSRDFGT